MKSLEIISEEISTLEGERDFGDIIPEGEELLAVLNLCYDLLSRTKCAQQELVLQPEEMKEPGFEDEFISKYGISTSQLANFAFSVTTKQGKIDLRGLLSEIMYNKTAKEIAENIGIRNATLSDYRKRKSGFTVDSYEAAINYCIQKNPD